MLLAAVNPGPSDKTLQGWRWRQQTVGGLGALNVGAQLLVHFTVAQALKPKPGAALLPKIGSMMAASRSTQPVAWKCYEAA